MNIYITEQKFKDYLYGQVKSLLKESEPDEYYGDYDTPESLLDPKAEFDESGFEDYFFERYPDLEATIDVSDDGTVTVTDLKTGKFYTGQGQIEYEISGMGYPSRTDYDSEQEEILPYYDFTNCLETIMKKIDTGRPDGQKKC